MRPERRSSVFISYRREDTAWPARQVYEVLAREFRADRVFKDVDNIEPGENFVERIGSAVAACDVLLVLIGPRWMSSSDGHGSRRLDEANDFVRLEIRTALDRNIEVIPILVDGAAMPDVSDLPPDIASLTIRQAIEISPVALDAKRLTNAVRRAMGRQADKALPPAWSPPKYGTAPEPPAATRPASASPVSAPPAWAPFTSAPRAPAPLTSAPLTSAPSASGRVVSPPQAQLVSADAQSALRGGWRRDRLGVVALALGAALLTVGVAVRVAIGGDGSIPAAQALTADQLVVAVTQGQNNSDLWVVDGNRGDPVHQLTFSPDDDLQPNISPDRRTVLYRRAPEGEAAPDSMLRMMAVDGTGDRPFDLSGACPSGVAGHAWNPADPSQLVITCSADPKSAAHIVGLDGRVIRTLSIPSGNFGDVTFSSDGARLAFWSSPYPAAPKQRIGGSIWVWDVATGQARPVTKMEGNLDADVAWSPTETDLLAFRRHDLTANDSNIMTIRADGSDLRRRTNNGATEDFPSFSPDGSKIAYRSRQKMEPLETRPRLWRLDLATGRSESVWKINDSMVTHTFGRPVWTSR